MQSGLLGEITTSEFNDYTAVGQILFELSEGINFPTIAHFQNQQHDITYIAARHSVGHGIKHETCQEIIEELSRQKPDCIIIEGIAKHEIENGRKWGKEANIDSCSESELLLKFALENDILFFGGEPDDGYIKEKLLQLKYNEADIYYRRFIGTVRELYKSGIKYNSIEEYLNHYSNNLANYPDFKMWCEGVGYKPNLSEMMGSECSAPIKNGDFIQRMAYDLGRIRNINILETLEECTEAYKKVLIVYGCSHYYEQYPILKHRYGTPTYTNKSFVLRMITHVSNVFNYMVGK